MQMPQARTLEWHNCTQPAFQAVEGDMVQLHHDVIFIPALRVHPDRSETTSVFARPESEPLKLATN